MSGTIAEVKSAIITCLSQRYPGWYTESGISTMCFNDKVGADGLPLLALGEAPKLRKALDELINDGRVETEMESRNGSPEKHYRAKL